MKAKLLQNPLLVVGVVAALAAGTVLVAGYTNDSNATAAVAAEGECRDCPAQGTDACCKNKAGAACSSDGCSLEGGAAGSQAGTVTGDGGASACYTDKAAGACSTEGGAPTEQAGTVSGCGSAKTACGSGGCAMAQ
jgi:hypothetical protein